MALLEHVSVGLMHKGRGTLGAFPPPLAAQRLPEIRARRVTATGLSIRQVRECYLQFASLQSCRHLDNAFGG